MPDISIEAKLKAILGDLIFQVASLQSQVDQLSLELTIERCKNEDSDKGPGRAVSDSGEGRRFGLQPERG